MSKRYLCLEDGAVFEGEAFGADAEAIGELVFATGMGGYVETLTDPSFCGQIVLQTFPMIGAYGVCPDDFEGDCRALGYVVREWVDFPSNFRSRGTVDEYLKSVGVPGISGVDTREITTLLRERGVMNAMLCDAPPKDLSKIKAYRVRDAVRAVTHEGVIAYPAESKRFTVALIDYGAKRSIIKELNARGCEVLSLPAFATAEEVLALSPDGVMLSNGPGDPSDNPSCIEELKKLLGKRPMFGICLGHQLLALSDGARVVKMKYGHHGENQPVRDLASGRTYVTSQNHGYAIEAEGLTRGVVSHINANDGSCEGVAYPDHKAFTVQFHPEAAAGPRDTMFLFDRFIAMMEEYSHAT